MVALASERCEGHRHRRLVLVDSSNGRRSERRTDRWSTVVTDLSETIETIGCSGRVAKSANVRPSRTGSDRVAVSVDSGLAAAIVGHVDRAALNDRDIVVVLSPRCPPSRRRDDRGVSSVIGPEVLFDEIAFHRRIGRYIDVAVHRRIGQRIESVSHHRNGRHIDAAPDRALHDEPQQSSAHRPVPAGRPIVNRIRTIRRQSDGSRRKNRNRRRRTNPRRNRNRQSQSPGDMIAVQLIPIRMIRRTRKKRKPPRSTGNNSRAFCD